MAAIVNGVALAGAAPSAQFIGVLPVQPPRTATIKLNIHASNPNARVSRMRDFVAGNQTYVATNFTDSLTNYPDTLIISPMAQLTVSNLVQRYTGTPKAASVSVVPAGLAVNLTYNGSTTPPTDPGTYRVMASVSDATYSGRAAATLVIQTALVQQTLVGRTNLQFNVPGQDFWIVQASTNIANPNAWVNIRTNFAPFTITDTNAARQFPRRFYRIISP